ncbi:MAG TPA: energy transducer TonB [Pyrinomonadaceae bacterium]|nr:energy transducer TonB [Pyrinomonadaceae bacterium]
MRSLLLRVHVAVLAFAVGVAASAVWDALRGPAEAPEAAETPARRVPGLVFFGDSGREGYDTSPHPYGCPPRPYDDRALSRVQARPDYPPEALSARVSGEVGIWVVADESGRVVMAHPVSGHTLLREAAADAACRSRFPPAWLLGRSGWTEGMLTFNFVLP